MKARYDVAQIPLLQSEYESLEMDVGEYIYSPFGSNVPKLVSRVQKET